MNLDIFGGKIAVHVFRIVTAGHNVSVEPVAVLFVVDLLHYIFWTAGSWIMAEAGNHAADFASWDHLVGHFDRAGIGDELMV